ncbi:MAG TPA: hypothetical protein PKC14_02550, partial [Candidatus Absconditabacterales bacterium]|nr:hypothetical protein [Candidatus Absconditabacterales bacterium]
MVKKTGLNDKKKTVEKKVVTRKKSTSKKSLVENQNENILEKKDSGFLMGKNFIPDFGEQVLTFRGVKTHNLRNIDIDLPKNKIITVTGVSGSGKSSFAFDTVYKEGQYRYIESLSSYLRQFFNLGERPDIDYSSGLSPAIAIEQNKRVGNARSTVGTLTEIDDYLRLLFAKLGDIYSYGSGKPIKAQTIDQIIDDMKHLYLGKKIYLVQLVGHFDDSREFLKFVKKNRMKVEQGEGFTRYLMVMNDKKIPSSDEILLEKDQEDTMMGNFGSNIKISGSQKIAQKTESESSKSVEKQTSTIEYFYLESPHVPEKFFPVQVYGIFDRVTVEEQKIPRLKEDIVKILGMSKKFGVYCSLEDKQPSDSAVSKAMDKDVYNLAGQVKWYTDKNYCPDFDITYPDFAPHHFSPNRAEGACPVCHGLGENLNVDFDRILDPHAPFMKAVLPWRDSVLGQTILKKLAQKYSMNEEKLWKDQPDWFKEIVLQGDNEILRIGVAAKNVNMTYKGIQDVLTTQYNKGLLTVDFQAMFELKPCTECHGAKLRKESLYVFLYSGKPEKKPLNIKVDDMSKM